MIHVIQWVELDLYEHFQAYNKIHTDTVKFFESLATFLLHVILVKSDGH